MTHSPPPDDWDELLDRFTRTLSGVQQTLAKATACQTPPADEGRAQVHEASLAQQAPKLEALGGKATEITRWVDAIESELRVSEDLLRVLLNQTETVRQKLATWTGRAIG